MEHHLIGVAIGIQGEDLFMADMEDNTDLLLLFNNQELLILMLVHMLDMAAGEDQVWLILDMEDTEDTEDMVDLLGMDIQSITRV